MFTTKNYNLRSFFHGEEKTIADERLFCAFCSLYRTVIEKWCSQTLGLCIRRCRYLVGISNGEGCIGSVLGRFVHQYAIVIPCEQENFENCREASSSSDVKRRGGSLADDGRSSQRLDSVDGFDLLISARHIGRTTPSDRSGIDSSVSRSSSRFKWNKFPVFLPSLNSSSGLVRMRIRRRIT